MSRYRITPPAAQDMEEIYEHVAQDNLPAAGRLIELLTDTLRLLADMPGMERMRDDLSPGSRSFPVGAYLSFYRQAVDGIHIVRLIHGARDIQQLFP